MADPTRRCVCGHTYLGHIPAAAEQARFDYDQHAGAVPALSCQLMVCDCRAYQERP